jgi:hypothetical protein
VPGVRENGGQYTHARDLGGDGLRRPGRPHERAWELLAMINPVNHALSAAAAVATYKVEPYVVAADVYAVAPHTGRGGWSWYTGSAGWMYRLDHRVAARPAARGLHVRQNSEVRRGSPRGASGRTEAHPLGSRKIPVHAEPVEA